MVKWWRWSWPWSRVMSVEDVVHDGSDEGVLKMITIGDDGETMKNVVVVIRDGSSTGWVGL